MGEGRGIGVTARCWVCGERLRWGTRTKVKVCAFEESVCWECGKAIEMLILREYMGC